MSLCSHKDGISIRIPPRAARVLAAVALGALVSGCASPGGRMAGENDPLEPLNRAVFRFNDAADRNFVKPAAKAYNKHVPAPVRKGIRNFFRNAFEPTVIVNDFLQGKIKQGLADGWRFAINTTVGLLGFIDVASKLGLEPHKEDFGQTLAKWGVGEGPYLVLPFLGPSNLRDGLGLIPYYRYTNPLSTVDDREAALLLLTAEGISVRADLLGTEAILEQAALDRYRFVREAYRQKRLSLIHDGRPPLDYELED